MITKQELSTAQSLAPLLSEGAISPFQVSNMSKREKAEREKNIELRYKLEHQYKKENMTEQEKDKEKLEDIEREIKSINTQIQSSKRIMESLRELRAFESPRINATKRSVIIYEEENKERINKINELQGRLRLYE